MQEQEMTLNIRYDLPEELWHSQIPEIYQAMEGWLGYGTACASSRKDLPHWFSFEESEKHVFASIEPGGLVFSARMEEEEWELWCLHFKKVATQKLGFKVGEIETGEVEQ